MSPEDEESLREAEALLARRRAKLPKPLEPKPTEIPRPPEGRSVVEVTHDCELCGDRGWVVEPDGGAGRASTCVCHRPARIAQLELKAEVPPLFVGQTFADFRVAHGDKGIARRLTRARDLSARYVENFLVDEQPRPTGLGYIGPPGSGKSHLAATVLQDVIGRYGVPGLFVNFTVFMAKVRSTYSADSEEETMAVLKPAMEVTFLVLDELGRQKPTEHTMDTLHLVLEARYLNRRPTLFTSNFPLEPPREFATPPTDPQRVRRDPPPSLRDRISAPLVSRLHEMVHVIEMGATWDFRRDVLAYATTP